MFKPQILVALLSVLMGVPASTACGDLILTYTGVKFTEFVGAEFSTDDRISGTVVFDSAGSAVARAFTLSTTLNNAPGFTFDVQDVAASPFSIAQEFTEWDSLIPVKWNLTVQGDLGGDGNTEEITISFFGDQASINFPASVGGNDLAVNTSSNWTVASVPEPSVGIVVALIAPILGSRRCCRSRQQRRTQSIETMARPL